MRLALARRRPRLINLPFHTVYLNFLGWIPGAVFFPLLICALGGTHEARAIWAQFAVSFTVSAIQRAAGSSPRRR